MLLNPAMVVTPAHHVERQMALARATGSPHSPDGTVLTKKKASITQHLLKGTQKGASPRALRQGSARGAGGACATLHPRAAAAPSGRAIPRSHGRRELGRVFLLQSYGLESIAVF